MNAKLQAAIMAGQTAPETPDTDTGDLILVDCVAGEEQSWIEKAEQKKPLRPSMKSRAGKPKLRHAHKLDSHCQIRRRRDKRQPAAVDRAPSPASIMRRSGYVVKGGQ